jgi:hypothetical protein
MLEIPSLIALPADSAAPVTVATAPSPVIWLPTVTGAFEGAGAGSPLSCAAAVKGSPTLT